MSVGIPGAVVSGEAQASAESRSWVEWSVAALLGEPWGEPLPLVSIRFAEHVEFQSSDAIRLQADPLQVCFPLVASLSASSSQVCSP